MKNIILIAVSITLISIASCKKEDSDTIFKLETPLVTDSGVILKWNVPNVKDFLYYKVLRSIDQINYSPIPISDSGTIFLCNYSKSTTADLSYVTGHTNYYKLVAHGSNDIYSNTVKIQIPNPTILNVATLNAFAIPNSNNLLILQWNNNFSFTLYVYNHETNKILKSINIKNCAENTPYCLGDNGNGCEFYLNRASGYFYIYDAISLELKDSIGDYRTCRQFTTDNKGHIVYYSITELCSVDIKNKTVNSISADNYIASFVYYLPSSNRFVCEADNGYNYYKIDNNNNIYFNSYVPISQPGSYYYISGSSQLYSFNVANNVLSNSVLNLEDGNINHFLNLNKEEISILNCSSGDNKIMVLSPNYKIYFYSQSSLKLLKLITISNNPNVMLTSGNYIICLTSISKSTIVDKIKIK